MQLGPGVAMAVTQASSYISDSTPSLRATGAAVKRKKISSYKVNFLANKFTTDVTRSYFYKA